MRKIICCIVCLLLIGFISEVEGKVPKELRQPEDSNSSLLALSFGPLKTLSDGLGKKVYFSVLFAKIDSAGNGDKPEIIASNYSRNGRAYLINAKPGTYAAVALLRRVLRSTIGVGIGSGGAGIYSSMGKSSAATFFSEEIVQKSTIEVKPGEFAFMGNFEVDRLPDISKGDPVQQQYHREFVEMVGKKDPALANLKVKPKKIAKESKRNCKRGVLKKHEPLDMTFFLRIKSDFTGTGWNDIIQERWQEVLDKKNGGNHES